MNIRKKLNPAVNILMLIGILLCMPYLILGETAHEYIGIAVCILFIIHNIFLFNRYDILTAAYH